MAKRRKINMSKGEKQEQSNPVQLLCNPGYLCTTSVLTMRNLIQPLQPLVQSCDVQPCATLYNFCATMGNICANMCNIQQMVQIFEDPSWNATSFVIRSFCHLFRLSFDLFVIRSFCVSFFLSFDLFILCLSLFLHSLFCHSLIRSFYHFLI